MDDCGGRDRGRCLGRKPAVAQVTTATVSATVKNGQGAVAPGATAVLMQLRVQF